MNRKSRALSTAIAIALAAGFGAGISATAVHAEDTLERIKDAGFVRVGFANEAPYAFATSAGKLTGEAPEIAKAILAKMGVAEVDGVLTEFGSLIPGIKASRFDIIAAGMFINPKRCEQIAFSEPTYKIAQAFLVKAGNPKNIKDYDTIAANTDLKLAVMAGAVEKGYAEKAGVADSQLVNLPDPPSLLAAVKAGRADAAALTTLSIGNLVEKGGDDVAMTDPIEVAGGESVVGYGGFGFRTEDKALVAEFNKHLKEFIGSDAHKELVHEFGFGRDYMLPDKTTAELCAG